MEFPQVDMPVDAIAWTEVTEEVLNVYKQSCRLKAFVVVACLEGSITASINLKDIEVKQGDLVTLLPGSIIQIYEQKDKLRLGFIGFSSEMVSSVNMIKAMNSTFSIIMKHPVLPLPSTIISYFDEYFTLWSHLTTGPYTIQPNMVQSTLKALLEGINYLYENYHKQPKTIHTRRENICQDFMQLVIDNYTKERQAQFYADKLGITLQYLSAIVKQVTGKNALDIIAQVILTDVKAKLKSTDMTVQQIAYSLNFPNASFFCKYFKRYMGITPIEYRASK